MNKDNLNILSEMLENHEWNSYYSSNHSAWSDGKSALSAIHKFIHLNGFSMNFPRLLYVPNYLYMFFPYFC